MDRVEVSLLDIPAAGDRLTGRFRVQDPGGLVRHQQQIIRHDANLAFAGAGLDLGMRERATAHDAIQAAFRIAQFAQDRSDDDFTDRVFFEIAILKQIEVELLQGGKHRLTDARDCKVAQYNNANRARRAIASLAFAGLALMRRLVRCEARRAGAFGAPICLWQPLSLCAAAQLPGAPAAFVARDRRHAGWLGPIQVVRDSSAGAISRLTTTASWSLRTRMHSSGSSGLALISWCGTKGGT